jgi:1-deoxy-D-xylulose-5-phosphate synthase
MRNMLLTAIEYPGPAAIRYPRGNGIGVDISSSPKKIEIGKAEILREGGELAILAYGSMVYPTLDAADKLAADGRHVTVVNARFVKPLDAETILSLARKHRIFITVEDAYLAGGFGSAVMELLEMNGLLSEIEVHRLGVANEIVTHGDPKILLAKYGLNVDGIYTKAREVLDENQTSRLKPQRLKAVK